MQPPTSSAALSFRKSDRLSSGGRDTTSVSAPLRIAVLGSEPQLYFLAHRKSATGYIYTYGLMEPQPYASTMQQEMIREIEAAAPRFVVIVSVRPSWLAQPASDPTIFSWSAQYVQRMERVGLVDLIDDDTTIFHWGDTAKYYSPRSAYNLTIWRRPD